MSRPAWLDVDCGGYLGKDPELRTTTKGSSVTNISIAIPLYYNKETVTEWMHAALFGQLAEFCCKYAKKGDLVRVTGMLLTKTFQSRGEEKSITEVQADSFKILKRKNEAVEEDEL